MSVVSRQLATGVMAASPALLQSMLQTLLHKILLALLQSMPCCHLLGLASVVTGQLATGVMDANSSTKNTGCGDEPYARDARRLTASALIAKNLQLLLVHSWSCAD